MERPEAQFSLLEATRIVARGSELDEKLDALCRHVLSADAAAAVVYLYDPVAQLLVPAAQAGLNADMLAGRGTISADDPNELISQVARERRPMTAEGSRAGQAFDGQHIEWRGLAALPLIASDESGGEDAEGVLLAAFRGAPPDITNPDSTITVLADLCAVAIRQARLESALLERADWIGRLANTDALTGLANRVTFERMLELEIARATRQDTQVSVVLFDIDGLAQLNEAEGGAGADEVLRHVAATLADQVRLIDTVARYGADEFALIAPGGGGEVAGRRVRDAIARRESAGQPISLSVGAVVYPLDGATSEELLSAAGRALAEAKRRGKGTIFAASG